MDIKTSIAAQTYAKARQAAAPEPAADGTGTGFATLAESFADTLMQGEATAKAAMVGDADRDSPRPTCRCGQGGDGGRRYIVGPRTGLTRGAVGETGDIGDFIPRLHREVIGLFRIETGNGH